MSIVVRIRPEMTLSFVSQGLSTLASPKSYPYEGLSELRGPWSPREDCLVFFAIFIS